MKEYSAKELYPEIYAMKPQYEYEPGWWKLKWKPIWRGTYAFYKIGRWKWNWWSGGFAFQWWREDARNGWGRYYKCFSFRVVFLDWTWGFWIKWDYRVMAKGPGQGTPVPLDIPGMGA